MPARSAHPPPPTRGRGGASTVPLHSGTPTGGEEEEEEEDMVGNVTRAALQGEKRVHNANENERSRGRSLLHGQDMDKTQHHRGSIAAVAVAVAVGGLAVGRLVAVSGWRLAVGGP